MLGLATRAVFAAALSASVVGSGCGNEPRGPFNGACEPVTSADDGTTSCWEAQARTIKQLQDVRAALCDVPEENLLPVWSRCSKDSRLGGCRAAFGVADDPSVMTQALKWYYTTATVQTEDDVKSICMAGDGVWLLGGGPFVPPDGNFPPLD